ncbi:hypothetical protein M3616_23510, partial [Bacillus velezensis]|nr:hypothetical protein [Bacillus velezensis]
GQHVEAVDRVNGQVDGAAVAYRPETLRRVEAGPRDEGRQLVGAVEVIPFGFAGRVGEAAFHGVDHRIVLRDGCASWASNAGYSVQ